MKFGYTIIIGAGVGRPVGILAALMLVAGILAPPLAAQEYRWSIAARVGGMTANGQFTAVRPNGKTISSDIGGGAYLSVGVERRLSKRWGVTLGYEGSPSLRFTIDQDFPNGTDFSSSDTFAYSAINAGAVFRILSRPTFALILEPYLSWAWFGDVTLAVAGPPFDRTAPLAIDVDSRLGAGAAVSGRVRLGTGGWGVGARAGLTIQRFQGTFPDDPSMPGSGGDVDVPFNPLYLALDLSYAF